MRPPNLANMLPAGKQDQCVPDVTPFRRKSLRSRNGLRPHRRLDPALGARAEGDGSDQSYYRGSLTMFERAGFATYRDAGKYLIVRKPL